MQKSIERVAVYTSCAANYLAKAALLSRSVVSKSFKTDFHLLYCDQNDKALSEARRFAKFTYVHTLESMGVSEGESFQYNVMELCTKVKGAMLSKLVGEYDAVVYLDPDAVMFSPLDTVLEEFKDCEIGLTPHFVKPLNGLGEAFRLTELSVLRHGLYNLGFLFVRSTPLGKQFAEWWSDRLEYNCYDEPLLGKFTDQRVMDLVPLHFPRAKVSRAETLNVASWNIHEKELSFEQKKDRISFFVNGEPLIFYHFSGVNSRGVSDFVTSKVAPSSIAVKMIEAMYRKSLLSASQDFFEQQAFFGDKFANGQAVTQAARRLYRNHSDLQIAFPAPLSHLGYFDWLSANRPAILNMSPSRSNVQIQREFKRLFDREWYRANYALASDIEPIRHYVDNSTTGEFNPHRFFDTDYLLLEQEFPLSAPQLKQPPESHTPLFQLLLKGSQSEWSPNRFFNESWYLSRYSDVRDAVRNGVFSSGFYHFCVIGSAQGRDPGPLFSEERYRKLNPDVDAAVAGKQLLSGFDHFIMAGLREGRLF